MSDQNPPIPETEEEKARRIAREALFEDIDEADEAEETIESLRADRARLQEENSRLTTSVANAQRDNVRLNAEAEEARNLQRRNETKFEQDKKFAVEKFVTDLLPVIDTLELGLKAIPDNDRASDAKFERLAGGIEKTLLQLTGVFNKFGIREINPLGEEFDETKHEVLATAPKPDTDSDIVIDVQQKGYEIEGRLIRPAKVIITP